MRVTLAGLLLTAALVVVPCVDAQSARLAGQLPTRGVFVPGVSLDDSRFQRRVSFAPASVSR